MSEVKTGVVRVYNSNLKKGLIKCDDGSLDIPIYKHQLEKFSIPSLKTGDSVRIEIEKVGNSHTILAIEFLE
jgi:cold shock CspA family protein